MKIKKAFCTALGEKLTIEEAQQRFWEAPSQKRFKFECEDDRCRAARHPTVTGVLYHSHPADRFNSNRMRFQRGPDADHLPTCPWQEQYEAWCRLTANPDRTGRLGNRWLSFNAVKPDEVPDILLLPGPNAAEHERDAQVDDARIDQLSEREDRIAQYVRRESERLEATSVFGRVVDAYLDMEAEDRRKAQLTISGFGTRSYGAYFQPSSAAGLGLSRVYYGGAHLCRDHDRCLRFYDPVTLDGNPFQLHMAVPERPSKSRLDRLQFSFEGLVSRQLSYARAFFLGTVAPSTEDNVAVALPYSPAHLVLIAKVCGQK